VTRNTRDTRLPVRAVTGASGPLKTLPARPSREPQADCASSASRSGADGRGHLRLRRSRRRLCAVRGPSPTVGPRACQGPRVQTYMAEILRGGCRPRRLHSGWRRCRSHGRRRNDTQACHRLRACVAEPLRRAVADSWRGRSASGLKLTHYPQEPCASTALGRRYARRPLSGDRPDLAT